MENQQGLFARYRIRHPQQRHRGYQTFLAEDARTGKNVLLKVPHDELRQNRSFVERFAAAGQSAANLRHRNIEQVYEVTADDAGAAGAGCIVAEYVESIPLGDLLADRSEPVDANEVIAIVQQIAEALDHAHQQGVYHWSVDPAHVRVTTESRIFLTDFGELPIDALDTDIPASAVVCELTSYTAPELVLGLPADGRADVYGLGVLAYRMLTGQDPFSDADADELRTKIVNDDPPPPFALNAAIVPGITQVISGALVKDPAARFATATDFARALNEGAVLWSSGAVAISPPPQTNGVAYHDDPGDPHPNGNVFMNGDTLPATPLPPPKPRRRRVLLPLAVFALLAFVGYAAWQTADRILEARAVVQTVRSNLVVPPWPPTVAESEGVAVAAVDEASAAGRGQQDGATVRGRPAEASTPTPAPLSTIQALLESFFVSQIAASDGATPAPTTPAAAPTATLQQTPQAGASLATVAADLATPPARSPDLESPATSDTPSPAPTEPPTPTSLPTATPTPTLTPSPAPTKTATAAPATETPRALTASDPPPVTFHIGDLVETLQDGTGRMSGRGPVGARVQALVDGAVAGSTLVDPAGNWVLEIAFGNPGSYALEIEAVDETGAVIGPAADPITVVVPGSAERVAAAAEAADADNAGGEDDKLEAPAATATPERVALAATATPLMPPVQDLPVATATPTASATATGTATATVAPTATASPTLSATKPPPTVVLPTLTPSPTATRPAPTSIPQRRRRRRAAAPTPVRRRQFVAAPAGAVKLLSPEDRISGSGRLTFSWQAPFSPPSGQAFELVFWRPGQDPLTSAFGLAAPTLETWESVDLNALDHALGNLLQPGEYEWGVLLVQTSPYRRIAFLGDAHHFKFSRTYGDGGSGGESSGEPSVGIDSGE